MEKIKILVVDDDPSIRKLYQEELRDEGYDVTTADSGAEALALVAKSKPDIIILDILMPEMDGVQTLRQIKKDIPDQRVIISSAFDYYEDAMVHSPDSYVLKSSDMAELKRTVRYFMEQGEAGSH